MTSLLGKKIGAFKIDALLGQGGMGTVYRAWQEDHKRFVALKILSHDTSRNSKLVERFQREALAGSILNHPNLVPVLGTGDYIGRHYIVMEYIEGRTLDIVFEERNFLPPPEVMRLAAEMGGALAYLHGAKFFHRDLKPSNVMIDSDRSARITDFGLVKASELHDLTQDGTLLGTMHYIPPEVIAGEPHTAASDIYQLGLILYEAATGEIPFGAIDLAELLERRKVGLPASIRKIHSSFPIGLDTLILNCLFPDPRRRYVDGAHFFSDLERLRQGEKVSRRKAVIVPGAKGLGKGPTAPRGGTSDEAGFSLTSFAVNDLHQDPVRKCLRPRNNDEGGETLRVPKVTQSLDATRQDLLKKLRALPRHIVAVVLVSLVFLGLVWGPWKIFSVDRSLLMARDFQTCSGINKARILWKSEAPYKSAVLLSWKEGQVERSRRYEGQNGKNKSHVVLLQGLTAGRSHRVRVLYPDGTKSFPHSFFTGKILRYDRSKITPLSNGGLQISILTNVPSLQCGKIFLRGRQFRKIPLSLHTKLEHTFELPNLPHPFLPATFVLEAQNALGEAFPKKSIAILSVADSLEAAASPMDIEVLIEKLTASYGARGKGQVQKLSDQFKQGDLAAWLHRFIPNCKKYFSNIEVGLDRKLTLANSLSSVILADAGFQVYQGAPVLRARDALFPFLRYGRRTVENGEKGVVGRIGIIQRFPRSSDQFIPINARSKLASQISAVSKAMADTTMRRKEVCFNFQVNDEAVGSSAWVELGLLLRDDGLPGYWLAKLNGQLLLPFPNPIRRKDVPKRDLLQAAIGVLTQAADDGGRYKTYLWSRFPRVFLRKGQNELRLRYGSYLAGTCYPCFLSTVRLISVPGPPILKAR